MAVMGNGTKSGLGRPVQAATTLSLSDLSGVTAYSPTELYLTARAGTPLADVEAALAERGQVLPFEPPDFRALYGTEDQAQTIGGIVAANLSGPARISAGAARDLLIGVTVVNGRAEAIRSGGIVMKNVTGYDLCKLMCGAHGTLGVLADVTFKVLPGVKQAKTIAVLGLSDADGQAVLSRALTTPFEVTGAAHLPAAAAARSAVPSIAGASATLMRLGGFPESLAYRLEAIESELEISAPVVVLDEDATSTVWTEIRDARPIAAPLDRPVWKISVAPTRGPEVVADIQALLDVDHFYDWAGGLVWLAADGTGEDAGSSLVRGVVDAIGGHATLVRAPDSVRLATSVFQPLDPVVERLHRGLKESFDPQHLLNPGRMYATV